MHHAALLAFWYRHRQGRRRDRQHKPRTPFQRRLDAEARRRRDRRIVRAALVSPSTSPFMKLFSSGDEQSLITLTGFDHASFAYILERYAPLYDSHSPYSADGCIRQLDGDTSLGGRPRSMTASMSLALALAWTRTRGSEYVLCMLFGVTHTVCSLFLRFSRRILLKVLAEDEYAAVRLPSRDEITTFQRVISDKYPSIPDVFAVADGLKLHLEQSNDPVLQNAFYNGWTHGHYVSNVFVFTPNGVITACAINAPGSMHDSLIAEWGGVYSKLERVYEQTGARCVVDSAFSKGDYPFLIKSAQDHLADNPTPVELRILQQATSVRQTAEWGMRAFQSSFPRIKDQMHFEQNGERKKIISSLVLLFNLRARLVGINQILSTFMPYLGPEANHLLN